MIARALMPQRRLAAGRSMTAPRRSRAVAALPVIACLFVLGLVGSAHAAPYNPPPPGLPTIPDASNLAFLKAGGLNTSVKSATAVEVPIQIQYVGYYSKQTHIGPHVLDDIKSWIFPISPPGAQNAYGTFVPIHVQTLSFGSLPTTLAVTISLPRDSRNLPIPLIEQSKDLDGGRGGIPMQPQLAGAVNIEISGVAIDGVPIDVGNSCRTSSPGALDTHALFWSLLDHGYVRPPAPTGDEVPYYNIYTGGQFRGSVDIPPFTGCHNGSEDLDPLFTGTLSGSDNIVRITATGISTTGAIDPCLDPKNTTLACGPLAPIPLPTNPVHR